MLPVNLTGRSLGNVLLEYMLCSVSGMPGSILAIDGHTGNTGLGAPESGSVVFRLILYFQALPLQA